MKQSKKLCIKTLIFDLTEIFNAYYKIKYNTAMKMRIFQWLYFLNFKEYCESREYLINNYIFL